MNIALDTRANPANRPDKGGVLTKAVLRAADGLGLKNAELAAILGISPAGVTRMRQGRLLLKEGSKEFELAALLVRLYRSLYALLGGDEKAMRAWMRAENTALDGIPAQRIQRITGLTHAVAYLDSRRAVV